MFLFRVGYTYKEGDGFIHSSILNLVVFILQRPAISAEQYFPHAKAEAESIVLGQQRKLGRKFIIVTTFLYSFLL
jgi:hypothetical protein